MKADIHSKLRNLGLDEVSSHVYVELCKTNKFRSGSKIALSLNTHRQYVYRSLTKLLSSGLVEAQTFKGRLVYKAYPIHYLKEKINIVNQDNLSIIDEISSLQKEKEEQESEIIIGTNKMIAFERERLEGLSFGQTIYIIAGYNDAYFETFNEIYSDHSFLKKFASKKVKVKFLGGVSERYKKIQDSLTNYEYKIIPNFKTGLMSILITNEAVIFYNYVNPPSIHIVKSIKIAESYKDLFESLWEVVPKIY